MIYVFLALGFEEIEALTPVDVFRRAGLSVRTVSVMEELAVTGSHGITVEADALFSEVNFSDADLLLLPGGMPGTMHLGNNRELREVVTAHANAGKPFAAICAAPSVLGCWELLHGKEAICYPGFEKGLLGAKLSKKKVVRDGNLVTAAGMGVALEFSLECLRLLGYDKEADQIHKGVIA